MSLIPFVYRLLVWYDQNKRDLPWRDTENPYIIWLSEIILQQTRVSQGLPYFERFLSQYPTIQDLARAPIDEVLRLWQGLGYYSRARNLHYCAQTITDKWQGNFPNSYKELLKLKGVGSYTAAAIASFAFNEPVAVVDGNVFRVISRYFGIDADISSGKGKKIFESKANELIPRDRPAEFNQAMMEFGSLQCVPKNPACENCPVKSGCFAYTNAMVSQLPVKLGKVKVSRRYFVYYHVFCDGYTLIKKRQQGDIWEGLYDFPLEEPKEKPENIAAEMRLINELKDFGTLAVRESDYWYKHILSHQRIFATFVLIEMNKKDRIGLASWASKRDYILVSVNELEQLGKPRLISRYLNGEK